jgi:hypothetical protein
MNKNLEKLKGTQEVVFKKILELDGKPASEYGNILVMLSSELRYLTISVTEMENKEQKI